jgi:hypothetical protein
MLTRPVTIAETTLFIRQAATVWSDAERNEFIDFIANNPKTAISSRTRAVSGKFDGLAKGWESAAAQG